MGWFSQNFKMPTVVVNSRQYFNEEEAEQFADESREKVVKFLQEMWEERFKEDIKDGQANIFVL